MVYVVPSYQRLYVWNREDQWEPLWSDVEDIANALVMDAVSKGSDNVDPRSVEAHFLGAVVLKMSGNTPDLARQLRVIDGQQRLTTLQLLVAAAVAELRTAGLPNPAERLKELTSNSSSSATSGLNSYKINHHWHEHGHDYERFSDVMRAALGGDTTDSIGGPMAECYRFFQQRIRDWLGARDTHSFTASSALATTLIMKLHLVGIYLDSHEKEHIIFETLNARGEPLTEWDKIKNYLLYRADQEPGLGQEPFFERYLARFDDPWWRKAVGRGAQRPRTDIFADYWLESRKKTPVAVRRVFREFQKHLDVEDQQLEPRMDELVQDALYFQRFEELDNSTMNREVQFHRRRLDLGIGAIWPLLLYLQRIDAEKSEREKWFAMLESYFVRRVIVGYQARSYDQAALELLNELSTRSDNQTSTTNIMLKRLAQYTEAARIWPSDSEVKHAVLNRRLPQYAQRLVLSAIEQRLISNWAGIPTLSPYVQIEHIMPRAWQPDSWPLLDSDVPTSGIEERNHTIETLGNLTLLNGRLNAAISNARWSIKRKEIQKSDNLFLNRRLLEESTDEWTEVDIGKRGDWMYSIIVDLWPRG